ncbi:LacI family DNA-binding transcriptional regulator [Aestuariibacter halophilus]|uniref:LacI family DNA-binding transcriptional regulator n=1 Tax=Fluctibacter halophilus TaxID=226011 RepID=A0ABS8G7P4_9ALTE|nr:LacI family DNA-binding transcriptional regulator [Aestuariibacter halophilus]MCC2616607.1 LacI family DNA-binding transcriptional regulator [Aestuariibacter halophilus]
MKKNKLTLKDVAQQLGVSTATISNAFNRPDQLSASRRQEILTACERIGYHGPNKAAQILRKGHSNIVALVLADSIEYIVSDPVASTLIKGVSSVLQAHGKHLLLYAGDAQSIRDVVDFVDGFICYGAPRNVQLAEEINQQDKPVVTVDFNLPGRPAINIDNQQAAYDIARKALNKDDKVAILGLRLIDAPTTCRIYDSPLFEEDRSISHRRLDGYLRAIEEAGLTISNDWIWHIPESGGKYSRQAAQEVLNSAPRPTTILCMSDIIALEVLQCALSMGIKVPQELKITGFDGIDEAARTRPYLTTVCQSSVDKGKAAAQLLLAGDTNSQQLPYVLKKGETC